MKLHAQNLSVDESPDAVVALAPDGAILFWSKAAHAIFAYASEEAVGQMIEALIVPPHLASEETRFREKALAQVSSTYDTTRQRKDGSLVDVCVTIKSIQSDKGQYLLSTMRDVTQVKVERDSRLLEARFGHVVESMPDGIVMANSVGRIVLANSQAEKMFGYSRGELIGKLVEELIPLRMRGSHVGHRARYVHQPRARSMGAGLELYGLRRDGSEYPVEISLSPLKTEEGTLVMSAIRDITERRKFERELQEKNAALEAANQELESFSYSISHDLRAPLRAMGGFARMLEKQFGSAITPEAKQSMDRIRENALRMGTLIDGLLDFSSLGRRSVAKRTVSPTDIAKQVYEDLRAETAGRAVEMQIEEMPPCAADATLLRQVYVNLLSNALKYTRARSLAVIQVGCLQKDGESVYFVRDNGAGFDMEYSAKLFKVFQRLHRADQFEGTGVGLAVIHRIVTRHGGRVWAEGEVEKGAAFYFTLEKKDTA
jgi:PAS domain S-box-containing protein